MSLTPNEIITYLEREGALGMPDASPWPRAGEAEEARSVLWPELFPTRRPQRDGDEWDLYGDEWQPDLPDGLVAEIAERSGSGPTSEGVARVDQPDVSRVVPADALPWSRLGHLHS